MASLPSGMVIGGEQIDSASDGALIEVLDPATAQALAEVPSASVDDALGAVDAASNAASAWAATAPRTRAEVLRRTYEFMIDRADRVTGHDPAMSDNRRQPIASPTGERHLPSSVLDRSDVVDIRIGDRRRVFKCLHWLLRGCPQSVHIRATFRHVLPYLASSGGDNPWHHWRIQQYQGLSVVGVAGLQPATSAL